MAAATRSELAPPRLQDERSVSQLSYATIWHGGLGGSQTLTRSLQDFYALGYITSPKLIWWLWVDSNHQPHAYETLALFPMSYTAVNDLGSPRRS